MDLGDGVSFIGAFIGAYAAHRGMLDKIVKRIEKLEFHVFGLHLKPALAKKED